MVRLLKRFLSSQKGQALPIVLCVLAIGGLTIAGSLNYATTSLNGSRILREGVEGVYAAGAGVEHALWSLQKDIPTANTTPENINQMAVNIQTVATGNYTLYLGELIEPKVHSHWLDVDGDMVEEGGHYKYTITVTWQGGEEEKRKLIEVGARIPVGYSYHPGSAASFAENLSTDEPDETLDGQGAYLLSWELPKIVISEDYPVKTQTFYITGTGSQEGHYAWVIVLSDDVGVVSEITGALYKITATATRPGDGRITAEIVADVMIGGGTITIVSWQITK